MISLNPQVRPVNPGDGVYSSIQSRESKRQCAPPMLKHREIRSLKSPKREPLKESEKQRILYGFNHRPVDYSWDRAIHHLFEAQAERTPQREAVVDESRGIRRALTYKQLNEKSRQLARLLRGYGVSPGTVVGIMTEPGIEMMVGILGILKAGGAYMPMDAGTPNCRKTFMLRDSGAFVLLTQQHLCKSAASLAVGVKGGLIVIPLESSANKKNGNALPPATVDTGKRRVRATAPEDPAYVMYTSGTSGNPRGVVVWHTNLTNLAAGLEERIYQLHSQGKRIAMLAPPVADGSVKQIFATLTLGHTLYPVPPKTRINGDMLLTFYRRHRISISDATPTHIPLLAKSLEKELETGQAKRTKITRTTDNDFPVKHVIVDGKDLPVEELERFLELCPGKGPRITNIYGSPECTVASVACEISRENLSRSRTLPMGSPLLNHRVYVLDEDLQVQPIGVPGRIWISGEGVGKGYLNQPELTAQHFIKNPFVPGTLMVETGDMARWLPDGSLEYCGNIGALESFIGHRRASAEHTERLLKRVEVKEAVVLASNSGPQPTLEKKDFRCA